MQIEVATAVVVAASHQAMAIGVAKTFTDPLPSAIAVSVALTVNSSLAVLPTT
jgi:hypothetical protein